MVKMQVYFIYYLPCAFEMKNRHKIQAKFDTSTHKPTKTRIFIPYLIGQILTLSLIFPICSFTAYSIKCLQSRDRTYPVSNEGNISLSFPSLRLLLEIGYSYISRTYLLTSWSIILPKNIYT